MNWLLEEAIVRLQTQPPSGISAAYLQGFLHRHRSQLLTLLAEALPVTPALAAWKQDHDRLRKLLLEAQRLGWRDVPFNQQVASLIQNHASRAEQAMLALVPDHQSPLHGHIFEEHRQLEPILDTIIGGQWVFAAEDLAALEHHFSEEEGAFLITYPPPFWNYIPLPHTYNIHSSK